MPRNREDGVRDPRVPAALFTAAAFAALLLLSAGRVARPRPLSRTHSAPGVTVERGTSADQESATEATSHGGHLNQRFRIFRYERRVRFFRRRIPYDAKTDASYKCCRLVLVSGDV